MEYKINLWNGSSWPMKDGHKNRAKSWTDTTRRVYVPPLHMSSKGGVIIHGHYVCDTIMKDTYINHILPQIEERKYLPCEFEVIYVPRYKKKDLEIFNETLPYYWNKDKLYTRNRYLDFRARLIQKFT